MSCGKKEALIFSMGLLTGTGSTLTTKILYEIESMDLNGVTKHFEKSIFQTWTMFFAMIFALPIHWMYRWYCKRNESEDGSKEYAIPAKMYLLLAPPAAFDLFATILANIGLKYVTVSVFQLVRCTVIVFVALLKVSVISERLRGYMWIGIALNMIAVLMVGATSFADTSGSDGVDMDKSRAGSSTLLIVLSCALQAAQYVFEEKLMDGNSSVSPLVVIGVEGVWGFILTSAVVYPIAYLIPGDDLGSYERFDDAFAMLRNSSLAQVVVALSLFMSLGFNVFAVSVTYLLNSIWHAILDNFRPITVWIADLLLFYTFTGGRFGEAWTAWSWLQLAAVAALLLGTAIFNATLKLPGFVYQTPEDTPKRSIASIETPPSKAYLGLHSTCTQTESESVVASSRQNSNSCAAIL